MAKPYPTQARLKELFDYNPDTGEFTRLITTGNNGKAKAGMVIKGNKDTHGHLQLSVDNVSYRAHRLAWVWMHGVIELDMQIDHINRIKDDNRACNLRLVTASENKQNTKRQINNTSGCSGVSKQHNKWNASIKIQGKRIHLGSFINKEDAIKVRIMAVQQYYTHAPVTPELIE
jgi:hypothetical protein